MVKQGGGGSLPKACEGIETASECEKEQGEGVGQKNESFPPHPLTLLLLFLLTPTPSLIFLLTQGVLVCSLCLLDFPARKIGWERL